MIIDNDSLCANHKTEMRARGILTLIRHKNVSNGINNFLFEKSVQSTPKTGSRGNCVVALSPTLCYAPPSCEDAMVVF